MKHRLYVDNKTIKPVGTFGIEFLIFAIIGNMKYIIGNINVYFYWERNILRILVLADSYFTGRIETFVFNSFLLLYETSSGKDIQ